MLFGRRLGSRLAMSERTGFALAILLAVGSIAFFVFLAAS